MSENLKSKTILGIFWSSIERFSLGTVQFVINLIMARLLLPSDYGMIGMLAIFLQISQAFVDSGFTNALIQRKDRTEIDFSTAFYFNVVIAFVFYIILFISAPWIAHFYNMPELITITRIISLGLIINSLSAVHKVKLTINVDFKTQSKASLTAIILSGSFGIWMAYRGWGVWALVFQSLFNSLLLTVLYFYLVHWKPLMIFSRKSFNNLFSFGSKLLFAGMINTVYRNLYTIVIGRKFSAVELGYYTRADQFAVYPSANLNGTISRVMYPILSSIQNDNVRLAKAYRMYIQYSSYLIFPLMVMLAALARPMIELLLTDKWSGVIILLQILCFDWMFDHLSLINLNLLYVKGRSDLALKLEIVKKIIATSILFASIPFGLIGMCWGRVLYSLIAAYLNANYTNELIGISFIDQMKDIFPYLFLALSMGGIVYGITFLDISNMKQLTVGITTGFTFYIFFSFIFKVEPCRALLKLISKWKKK
mgnify:CR=1 FL=1